MKGGFSDQVRSLASLTPLPSLTEAQITAVEVGRQLAAEFIAGAREGRLPVDGLLFATILASKMGEHHQHIMRGLMQDLQKALSEVPR